MIAVTRDVVETICDSKDVSTYVKCQCGEEILEFQQFNRGPDKNNQDVLKYSLVYHGLLSRRDLKLGYNDFYFEDVGQVKSFCSNVKRQINEYNTFGYTDSRLLYDYMLPETYVKKYGRGILEIHYDGYSLDLRKWANEKQLNKNKKSRKCSWELVLEADVALAFVDNIMKIIESES